MNNFSSPKDLLFGAQCFASPLADPSYPDFTLPPAWYSPFMNAMLFPSYKNPGLRWANLILEYPHRWLDVTTSMCLLRYFAGLAYDSIFDLILDRNDGVTTEDYYLTYRNSLEDLLDKYIAEVAPLQEAYALYWTVRVLKHAKEPRSRFLDPDHVEDLSWHSLDARTRYVYSELVRLANRLGVAALVSITGALNIAWPQMPTRESILDDKPYIVHLRNLFIKHINDPSNNPLCRFKHFVRSVDSSVSKDMSQANPEDVALFLYESCPALRPYMVDPCSHSCFCMTVQDAIKESDSHISEYSPLSWAVSLSTNIRSDCRIERETETLPESPIALIRSKRPRSLPYLIFHDKKCHVQRNVPDISTVAKLATFESLRQQENQIIRRGYRRRLTLMCPWEHINVYEDDKPSRHDAFNAESPFNTTLFSDYWHSISRFTFAKKLLKPRYAT